MPTRALSGARLVRDLGVTNEFLNNNLATTGKIQQVGSDRFLGKNLGSGTGNMDQVQPWYDVQVPDWTTGQHTAQWSTLQYYLSSVAESNREISSIPFINYFSTISSLIGKWWGGVLAPNGKIYCIPFNSDSVGVIDPNTNTLSTFGNYPGTGTWPAGAPNINLYAGGVLASNGKIYCVPNRASTVAIIDPSNNSVTTFGNFPVAANPYNSFVGAVVAPNGKIYFGPNKSTIGAIIDPNNNSIQTYSLTEKVAPLLAINGNIYMASGSVGAIIDPNNNSTTTFGFPANIGYGATHPNGKIYFPFNVGGTRIAVIDPLTNNGISVQIVGDFHSANDSQKCVVAPNGKIYLIPNSHTVSFAFDPDNNTSTSFLFSGAASNAYNGAIVAPNGNMYLIPYLATQVANFCFINNNNWNINVCTNPFFNKY